MAGRVTATASRLPARIFPATPATALLLEARLPLSVEESDAISLARIVLSSDIAAFGRFPRRRIAFA